MASLPQLMGAGQFIYVQSAEFMMLLFPTD